MLQLVMNKRLELVGKRFGRWTVLEAVGIDKHQNSLFKVLCDCGTEKVVIGSTLRRGISKSCGCLAQENRVKSLTKHGLAGTLEYKKFHCAKRKAQKLNATPPWANLEKIREIYKSCPKNQQVDHIIPLINDMVCGLHVESNLQYLTKPENLSKSNKFIPYITIEDI